MPRPLLLILMGLLTSLAGAAEPQQPAQTPPTREQLERREAYEVARDALDNVEQTMEAMDRKRKTACMKSFGHEAFCECLNEKLAFGVSFDLYVLALTRTDEELTYSSLSEMDRALVDSARNTREQCVKAL